MLSLSTEEITALAARAGEFRLFVWMTARNRSTGDPESAGFWTGFGSVTLDVVSAATGGTVSRTYEGAGELLGISGLTRSGRLDPGRIVTASLSQIDATVEQQIREYDPKRGPVEIHLGICTPGTDAPVAVPKPLEFGETDDIRLVTPEAGGYGSVDVMIAVGRELTRASTDTRSHQSQKQRLSTDQFFKFASVAADRKLQWGGEVDPPKKFGKKKKKKKGS